MPDASAGCPVHGIHTQTLTVREIEHETTAKKGMLGKSMIAIIGISPAIAFSDNLDHVIRDKVNQGLNVAGAAKTLVSDNVRRRLPTSARVGPARNCPASTRSSVRSRSIRTPV